MTEKTGQFIWNVRISWMDILYFVYPKDLKLSDFLSLTESTEGFLLFFFEYWFFFFFFVTVSKVFLFPSPKFPLICLINC